MVPHRTADTFVLFSDTACQASRQHHQNSKFEGLGGSVNVVILRFQNHQNRRLLVAMSIYRTWITTPLIYCIFQLRSLRSHWILTLLVKLHKRILLSPIEVAPKRDNCCLGFFFKKFWDNSSFSPKNHQKSTVVDFAMDSSRSDWFTRLLYTGAAVGGATFVAIAARWGGKPTAPWTNGFKSKKALVVWWFIVGLYYPSCSSYVFRIIIIFDLEIPFFINQHSFSQWDIWPILGLIYRKDLAVIIGLSLDVMAIQQMQFLQPNIEIHMLIDWDWTTNLNFTVNGWPTMWVLSRNGHGSCQAFSASFPSQGAVAGWLWWWVFPCKPWFRTAPIEFLGSKTGGNILDGIVGLIRCFYLLFLGGIHRIRCENSRC
jgi:hypothetical protein